MRRTTRLFPLVLLAVSAPVCNAQQVAQVQCAHGSAYVYLYSSITTLEIGETLKCGEQLKIIGRYDNFLEVRTENGSAGFVSTSDIKIMRSASGSGATATRGKGKASAKDASAKAEIPRPPAPTPEIVLPNQTPVHFKLEKPISSATAHVGDELNFEVTQDVVIRGVTVIHQGAAAFGTVTEAEPKRRMGRGGKLSVTVAYVRVGKTEKVPLHASSQEDKASDQKVGKVVPFMKGKDATLTEEADITGYVSGDIRLKLSDLGSARAATASAAKN
jgi:hypothetical protein